MFRPRCSQRKVYLFKMGNYAAVTAKLESFLVIFNHRAEETDINTLWNLFKDRLYSLFDKYIPTKIIKEGR